MLNISKGIVLRPQKVVVYGPEGIGKSTFASWTGAYPIIKEISGEPFWDRYWKTKPNEQ